MGTVIKFPRACGRRRTPVKAAGTAAVVIILPVVRIERDLEERSLTSSGVKAKAAKSVTMTKAATERLAKAIAKPAAGRKPRRKRAAPALHSPACGRG
jgi:hypothetical protein